MPRVRTRVNNVKAYRSVSLLSCSATELLTLQERVTRLRQGELDDEGLTCSFVSPSLFHALRGFFDLQHQASPAHDPFAHALVSDHSPTPPDALQAATDGDFRLDLEFQIRSQQMLYAGSRRTPRRKTK